MLFIAAEREGEMRCSILLVLITLLGSFVSGPVMATDHDPPRIMLKLKEVMSQLTDGEEIVFLDTRVDITKASVKSKIPNAILIKNGDVLNRVKQETPKDKLIVTYCT